MAFPSAFTYVAPFLSSFLSQVSFLFNYFHYIYISTPRYVYIRQLFLCPSICIWFSATVSYSPFLLKSPSFSVSSPPAFLGLLPYVTFLLSVSVSISVSLCSCVYSSLFSLSFIGLVKSNNILPQRRVKIKTVYPKKELHCVINPKDYQENYFKKQEDRMRFPCFLSSSETLLSADWLNIRFLKDIFVILTITKSSESRLIY